MGTVGPNDPPIKLNDKHRLLAYLIAAGFTHRQCSDALKNNGTPLSVVRISHVKQNPEFKKLVREIQTEHMGGTVRSVLAGLAQQAMPSLKKISQLRDYAEDEGVQLRAADRLLSGFEKAVGLGAQKEGDKGPLVQVNLTQVESETFNNAIREAQGAQAVDADYVAVEAPKALPAPKRSAPRAKTIAELTAELDEEFGPCEKYVESGAV